MLTREGLAARLDPSAWRRPAIFDWLQSSGQVAEAEMYRTFNCGIGLALVVPPAHADAAIARLVAQGEQATVIGRIEPRPPGRDAVTLA